MVALQQGSPTSIWQTATPVTVGWFACRTWKKFNKWCT